MTRIRQLPRGPVHHSMLQTVRRCPQQYVYKYVNGLRPVAVSLPLKRGLWLHSMLQADALAQGLEKGSLLLVPDTLKIPGTETPAELYVPEDGLEARLIFQVGTDQHGQPVRKDYPLNAGGMLTLLTENVYDPLPDEVKEELTEGGDELPEACKRIMRGYRWHNRKDLPKERPLLVEYEASTDIEGTLYHFRIDLLLETADRIVALRDWKSTKSIPEGNTWKLMESQLHLYPVALQPHITELAQANAVTTWDEEGNPVTEDPDLTIEAVEFDFLRTKPPTIPSVNKSGKLSRRQIETDAMTFLQAAKDAGLDLDEDAYETNKGYPVSPTVREVIEDLSGHNPFYIRHRLPRSKAVTRELLIENERSIEVIDGLHSGDIAPYRVVLKGGAYSCEYGCDFKDVCVGDLYGLDTKGIVDRDFDEWEPDDLDEMDAWLDETEDE